ncbi:glycerol-1-phosphate phosphohydrolase [Elsinoe australis]|uniref:Glycerol-1-phosphate phosphohydrolase n=1 Tax=Elsinoe australis TaxID=40998 RepID=A0A4U7AYW0_9PEZI|nr:glycerol-1-phosphate phosphohydrolase [Elsinoe australis]
MPDLSKASFSAPSEEHKFVALLFDMDGTIIDSTPAIEKYWAGIGAEIGVDPATILETSHGRRTIDTLAILAPHLANWDYICHAEGQVPKEHGADAVEIPGARSLLADLEGANAPWAIVTSGTRPLVQGWIDVMKLAQPRNLVTAEQVERGKPDPAAYLLGAQRLGIEASSLSVGEEVLVLEDAPSGVRAGKAAGFKVVALATSHEIWQLKEAGADWIVRDMRSVRMKRWDAGEKRVEVEILDALVG